MAETLTKIGSLFETARRFALMSDSMFEKAIIELKDYIQNLEENKKESLKNGEAMRD